MSRPPRVAVTVLVTLGLVLCAHLTMTAATSSARTAQPTSLAVPATAPRLVAARTAAPTAPAGPVAVVRAALAAGLAPVARHPRRGVTLGKLLRLLNVVRSLPQTCGASLMPAVGPITRNKRLDRAARRYAVKMARNDWFEHDAPDGTDPGTRMRRAGYRWSRWGENIAAGYTGVARVLTAWLASPGHCRTLMGDYADVGFGHAYDASSTYGHYWVQDFASPR